MIKNFTLIMFFSLLTTSVCVAQAGYKAGYVVDLKGDTLSGFVQDQDEYYKAKEIAFKRTESGPAQKFSIDNFTSFKSGNKIYVADTLETEGEKERSLFEVIIRGTITLYYYRDKVELQRYFVTKEGKRYELTNEMKIIQTNGRSYTLNSKSYQGILNSLTFDCEGMPATEVSFSLRAISNYIAKYNTCKGDAAYTSGKEATKPTFSKSIFVGANQSEVLASGLESVGGSLAKFKTTNVRTGLNVGIGAHLGFFKNRVFVDVLAEYNQKGAEAEKEKVDFNLHYLNISPGLSYMHSFGNFKPMLGVGFVSGYLLNKETAYTQEVDGERVRIFYSNKRDNEATAEFGYDLRLGFKYALSEKMHLVVRGKYSQSVITFDLSAQRYSNKVSTLQVGFEF